MNIVKSKRTATALTLFCVLAACFTAGTSAGTAAPPTPPGCEGDACSQVTLTFDEARQQYRARNNSADRWARVSASNLAAAASACLAPGAAEYLPLKSVVAPYRAEFDEPRCGAPDSYEEPPAR